MMGVISGLTTLVSGLCVVAVVAITAVALRRGDLAPALLAVHPLGKSPVIVDGAATVAESGAIVEYLIDRYGACRLECRPASFNRFPRAYPRARRLSARLGTRRSLFPISRCWRIES